jgi:hypothetical protein
MLKNIYNLKYLIVGTGRCGTVHMSRLLTSLDIMCGHESVFNYRGINYARLVLQGIEPCKLSLISKINMKQYDNWFDSNTIKADSSLYGVPFLDEKILKNTKILHLVRNPIKVVSSFFLDSDIFSNLNFGKCPYRKFIFDSLPELFAIKNLIERCVYYFNTWNNKILKKKLMIHQVENGLDENLCNFLCIKKPQIYFDDKKTNTWKKNNNMIKISDIPDGELKKEFLILSEKLGYNISYKKDIIL